MTEEREGATGEGAGWRSYRCPVCGHADEVAVSPGDAVTIRCSHCETPLEIGGSGKGAWASVQVADDDAEKQGP